MRQLTVAMFLLAALAGTAQAQRPGRSTRGHAGPAGLVLNVHAVTMPGFSIGGPDFDAPFEMSMGPGVGAQIGYAFGPRYMLYAGADLARLGAAAADLAGHWGFGMIELGGRVSFPRAASRVTPYLTAAVGTRGLGARFADFGDVKFHGMALSGGGGITYVVSPSVALNGAAVVSLGKFGSYEDPTGKFDANVNSTTSARLQLGLDWRP